MRLTDPVCMNMVGNKGAMYINIYFCIQTEQQLCTFSGFRILDDLIHQVDEKTDLKCHFYNVVFTETTFLPILFFPTESVRL